MPLTSVKQRTYVEPRRRQADKGTQSILLHLQMLETLRPMPGTCLMGTQKWPRGPQGLSWAREGSRSSRACCQSS